MVVLILGYALLNTAMWHQKKEKLINGPTFPNIFSYMNAHHFCSIALNRSHVMFIGYAYYDYSEFRSSTLTSRVAIFDYEENLWYSISDLELEYDLWLYNCRGSVAMDKSGKK